MADDKAKAQNPANAAGRGYDPPARPDVPADTASHAADVAGDDRSGAEVADQGPAGEQGSE
ncbi:MAG: hypothetical protein JO250_17620 [Armatimonadetes bacterium]|nr:hypothetical protein [Armatimonadota bacterium]